MPLSETGLALFSQYRESPVAHAEDLFPEPLQDFQPEVLNVIARVRSLAVKASRGSGKTRVAAHAALWYLTCFENSLVLIVAPQHSQAQNAWREVQGLWRSSRLPQLFPTWEILETEIRTSKPTWRMKLVSAESGERIEGAHGSGGALIIFDEAKSIEDSAFASALGSLGASPDSRVLAISTAGIPLGWFYRAFSTERDKWNAVLSISALEVPRLRPFAEEMKGRLGEFDPVYRAQYMSEFTGAVESPFFNFAKLEAAIERPCENECEKRVLGIDIARLGRDKTIVCVRRGDRIERFIELPPADLMATTGEIVSLLREIQDPKVSLVAIDAVGVGAGVFDRLSERLRETSISRFVRVEGIISGESPSDDESKARYSNRKTEAAMRIYLLAEQGRLSIPAHATFISEMASYQRHIASSGKQRIVDPSGKSPDYGDAAILAFSGDPDRVSAVGLTSTSLDVRRLLGYGDFQIDQ